MLSNDLKKGDRVRMRGTRWPATIADNKKGNIRLAEVEGWETELGSIYVWNIDVVLAIQGRFLDTPQTIDLTPAQVKDRDRIEKFLVR